MTVLSNSRLSLSHSRFTDVDNRELEDARAGRDELVRELAELRAREEAQGREVERLRRRESCLFIFCSLFLLITFTDEFVISDDRR